MEEIQSRYMEYNAHALSYTWKQLKDKSFVEVEMTNTLEELQILDESAHFQSMGIKAERYTPVVHVYFNDDLTCD